MNYFSKILKNLGYVKQQKILRWDYGIYWNWQRKNRNKNNISNK